MAQYNISVEDGGSENYVGSHSSVMRAIGSAVALAQMDAESGDYGVYVVSGDSELAEPGHKSYPLAIVFNTPLGVRVVRCDSV